MPSTCASATPALSFWVDTGPVGDATSSAQEVDDVAAGVAEEDEGVKVEEEALRVEGASELFVMRSASDILGVVVE